ncbi:MAG TPA: aminopeptidase P family N-terminal domain-containing protein, partial [Ilumatobacteraceae bacterium]|nr:aminopeptidase P family N-terminal domain-containing protein [Ilumatobacteraceae bacterium]
MIPSERISERGERVRRRFDQGDALLVTDLSNIRWLTGFTGSNGWALLAPDEIVLVTDGRYGDQATAQMKQAGVDGRVIVGLSGAAMLDSLATEVGGFGSIGFESAHVTYEQFQRFQSTFKTTLVPVGGVVEAERRTKDEGEIARMAEACRIADGALA